MLDKEMILNMISDIDSYKDVNLASNVRDRLDASLKLYLKELDNSYISLLNYVGDKNVVKELTKCK